MPEPNPIYAIRIIESSSKVIYRKLKYLAIKKHVKLIDFIYYFKPILTYILLLQDINTIIEL